MTEEERAERKLLRLANEFGKFAMELGATLPEDQQEALERLQLRGDLRLIDVTPLAEADPRRVFRVFCLTPEALTRFRAGGLGHG